MYKENSFLAIIPARGGSKGIKDKNIVDLCGQPLISYSIEQALSSKYIDEVVVSTNSLKIAEIAKKFRAQVPFIREDRLATDYAKSIDVILDCIDKLKGEGKKYDYIVLLQPTQPLRQVEHIDDAIKMMIDTKKDNLVSISKVQEHPVLMRTIDDVGNLKSLLSENSTQRRQDMKTYYKVNGAIYINKIQNLDSYTSLNDNEFGYIMDEKYDIDIDEILDLEVARIKIQYLRHKERG